MYNGTAVPDLTVTTSSPANTCNAYIPSTSTMARFQYVVDFLTSNGLYVVSGLTHLALLGSWPR